MPGRKEPSSKHSAAINIMTMGHRLEDLFSELLGEQDRALGLAGGAEIAGLARERNEMLGSTGRALETSKSSMKPTAVQESLDGGADHSSKRTRLGVESLLVGIDVIVEVLFEQLVKGGSLR